ncbi:molybdopterin-binding protein [Mesorhizobium sp. Root157]|uniref:molybdopterin-binding protein n=1 Tax=Mesorhizobium sp. Root157 TaxID=1736477 RepID=UPI0006FB4ECC|nr:molybdopterin-binding protein [Mesorhizobium sp. Root157]KQZ93830.1 molybdopterin-binding protein [Mesorhizobium sp. Root157]
MSRTQPSNGALTSLESALAELLDGLVAVAPVSVPLEQARGRIAAATAELAVPQPEWNRAVIDGWALRSLDLAGASSYSPVPLINAPVWVEAGDKLPDSCDCVLKAELVESEGPIAQAYMDAIPGEGIRRTGEDISAGRPVLLDGRRIGFADILAARAAGFERVAVRSPNIGLIDVAAGDGRLLTVQLIADLLEGAGMRVSVKTSARDAKSIAGALASHECDLMVVVGGTGFGRTDATAQALSMDNALIAHGIALRPGHTVATGKRGPVPVVALPGAPDQAFAAYHALVQPVLDRLTGRTGRFGITLPLARKISSTVGIAEIGLVRQEQAGWMPLGVGDLSLDHLRMADAWLAIAADSEGYAAGAPVEAFPLRMA